MQHMLNSAVAILAFTHSTCAFQTSRYSPSTHQHKTDTMTVTGLKRRFHHYGHHSPDSNFVMKAAVDDSDDDAELFDPLRSPHSYSKGVSGGKREEAESTQEGEGEWTPFQMKGVKNDFSGASNGDYKVQKSEFTRNWSASMISDPSTDTDTDTPASDSSSTTNDDVLFDPLISPHAYARGSSKAPIAIASKSKKDQERIGIILIDHGSRKASSNDHLHNLAELYQLRSPSHYVVKAAHMEIAEPSILDVVRNLVHEEKVSKVICHPYFLSRGRHLIEDVPELIQEAMDDVNKNREDPIEILTTNHVGSSMDLMVGLIGKMVDETVGVELDSGFVEKDSSSSSLGGFFGEVQRMMDEQL